MRKIMILGAFLGLLSVLGCSAEEEYIRQQRQWEEYARNWDVTQQNLEQTRLELDFAKYDTQQVLQDHIQHDWDQLEQEPYQTQQNPNETERDRDWPPQEDEESKPIPEAEPEIELNPDIIPLESMFEIKGEYNDSIPHTYQLTINQNGDVVIITNITDGDEIRKFSLHIKRFKLFWSVISSADIMSLDEFYGIWAESTDGFTGDLTIDIITEDGHLNKSVHFDTDYIRDKEFLKLLYMINWLVGDDMDVPDFLKPWLS